VRSHSHSRSPSSHFLPPVLWCALTLDLISLLLVFLLPAH
jgi:hypothetical protein